jgi:hypothetical protein
MNIMQKWTVPFIAACILVLSCNDNEKGNVNHNANIATKQSVAPVVYYAGFDTVTEVKQYNESVGHILELPNELIIRPGIYHMNGVNVDMRKEGLYRILFPLSTNVQAIVYENDPLMLISSLSWIITHGGAYDGLSDDSLTSIAKNAKLYVTCERAVNFVMHTISALGIKTRLIQGLSIEKLNGYDDGHVIMEVWVPAYDKWILVDVDNNALFKATHNEGYLNLVEFKDALDSDNLQIVPLALDTKVDASQFKEGDYSFAFLSEMQSSTPEMLKSWYKRVLAVTIVDNDYYQQVDSVVVKSVYQNARYTTRSDFEKKNYSK